MNGSAPGNQFYKIYPISANPKKTRALYTTHGGSSDIVSELCLEDAQSESRPDADYLVWGFSWVFVGFQFIQENTWIIPYATTAFYPVFLSASKATVLLYHSLHNRLS
jgi:hypothetical protein